MRFFLTFLLLCFLSAPVKASIVEPDYDPSEPLVTTPWYGKVGQAERAADLGFIAGMRPHHAGALTMSDDYLNSPDAANEQLQRLARGIKHNQTFEIRMLDVVERVMKKPAPYQGREWRRIATQGLAQDQQFIRAPIPGPLDGDAPVSARDVQFAKAMIIHHQAALDMAHDYLAQEAAVNRYLRLLCVDILRDQKMEIDFMQSVIDLYPGDPDDVKIDSSMIHGMEGMTHGEGHGHH